MTTTEARCSSAAELAAVAPRLAIIDGTHLCLLPFSTSTDAAADAVVVPALPLSSVWDRYHSGIEGGDDHDNGDNDMALNEYNLKLPKVSNTCLENMEKFILNASDLLDDDDCSSSRARLHMRHSQSLFINESGRGDGAEENDKSLHSLRIIALHDDDEIMVEETTTIAMNPDENRIEINLLSFAAPPDDNYDDEDFQSNLPFDDENKSELGEIYGGEYFNITSKDVVGNVDGGIRSSTSVDAPLAILDVIGAGSYLVTDLFGVPGYEQVLVLPRIVMDDATALLDIELWDDNGDRCGGTLNGETLQMRSKLLRVILEHSFITDGLTVLHPVLSSSSSSSSQSHFSPSNLATITMQGMNSRSKSTTTSSSSVMIPPLLVVIEDEEDNAMGDDLQELYHQRQNNGMRRKWRIAIKKAPVENGHDSSRNESAMASSMATKREEIPIESSNSILKEDEESPPEWLNAIARTVEYRLGADLSKVEQMERSAQTCLNLVNEGRETIHSAIRGDTSGRIDDPEVIRLRYGVRPRTSSLDNNGDGLSVALDFEVDLMMRPLIVSTNLSTAKEGGGDSCSSLQDFHLSCFFANRNSSVIATPPKTIRTVSGVVPTLRHGDCITILANVLIADLRSEITDNASSSKSSILDICIQGLWTKENCNLPDSPSSSTNNGTLNAASARHAAVLCILRLPVETLFLAPPMVSYPPQSNHWIQYEIDFISDTKSRSSNSSKSYPNVHPFPTLPTAIFEYRSHRTLTIDMSSSVQDTMVWKGLVSNINARIGGNSFIDLYWKKGDPKLNLVIFGSNMEERAAMVKIVLNSLPKSVKLVAGDPNEKQHVKALLQSMKKEVDTIKRHRSLSSDAMTQAVFDEMASLQIDTDGVASTLKRGWSLPLLRHARNLSMAEFDRANPLFERDNVSFEVFTYSGTQCGSEAQNGSVSAPVKRNGTFTVRILQGHRPPKNGSGDRERVIRFEMSDECNMIGNSLRDQSRSINTVGVPPHSIPGCRSFQYSLPHATMHTPNHPMRNSSDASDLHLTTIPHLPIQLFELEVGESDFHDLRRDQALLVDFRDFANSLISLLHVCDRGDVNSSQQPERNMALENNHFIKPPSDSNHGQLKWGIDNSACSTPSQTHQASDCQWQGMLHHGTRNPSPYGKGGVVMPVSTYTCRLEVNSPVPDESVKWRNTPKSISTHSRFSIVESNQFRELVHLALNLSIGTDKSVRLYLSLRLNQIMMQHRNIQSLYAEEQRRSDAAKTELLSLRKSMQELTQATENEKYQIHYQAEKRLQNENSSRLVEVNDLKASKDAEIKALNERNEKNHAILENKLRVLEEVNAKINSEKAATESERDLLATKLSFLETTNHTMANELSSVRSKLQLISEEKATVEKSLHQLQLQLTSLEYSKNTNEKTLFQTEAQRISAEKVSADAQRILSNQNSQMEELRRRLEEAEHETLKYKDLTSRYQANRLEMKKRMKDKAETIREQEDIFVAKEKDLSELRSHVQRLADELKLTKSEKEVLARELNDAKHQIQDNKKKLENNQQVIAWLNKQVSSGGLSWHGPKSASIISSTTKSCPLPPATISQVATLPRYMPAAGSTPFQRSYVTPDVKVFAGVPQQLHPEPTPYSVVRRQDAANKYDT